jgi:hypothetical protein
LAWRGVVVLSPLLLVKPLPWPQTFNYSRRI